MFFERLIQGHLLEPIGSDGNNKMFPIAWAVVEKETIESWDWFIQHLQFNLQLGDGLGWVLINDMQKACKIVTYVLF